MQLKSNAKWAPLQHALCTTLSALVMGYLLMREYRQSKDTARVCVSRLEMNSV